MRKAARGDKQERESDREKLKDVDYLTSEILKEGCALGSLACPSSFRRIVRKGERRTIAVFSVLERFGIEGGNLNPLLL
jgi:hypothetical protein